MGGGRSSSRFERPLTSCSAFYDGLVYLCARTIDLDNRVASKEDETVLPRRRNTSSFSVGTRCSCATPLARLKRKYLNLNRGSTRSAFGTKRPVRILHVTRAVREQRLSNKEIARQLWLSESTGQKTRPSLFKKLHATSRRELGALAERRLAERAQTRLAGATGPTAAPVASPGAERGASEPSVSATARPHAKAEWEARPARSHGLVIATLVAVLALTTTLPLTAWFFASRHDERGTVSDARYKDGAPLAGSGALSQLSTVGVPTKFAAGAPTVGGALLRPQVLERPGWRRSLPCGACKRGPVLRRRPVERRRDRSPRAHVSRSRRALSFASAPRPRDDGSERRRNARLENLHRPGFCRRRCRRGDADQRGARRLCARTRVTEHVQLEELASLRPRRNACLSEP